MKNKIFCVYDSKGEHFGLRPEFYANSADAIRAFEQAANTEDNTIGKFAADFTLFEIGEWDSERGICIMLESKVNLGCAIQFKKALAPAPVPSLN